MKGKEKLNLQEILAETDKLIEEAKAYLEKNGIKYQLDEWFTIKRYCERFNIKDTQIVTNWIRRGVIPSENVQEVEELNGLKLIKAVPYR